MEADDYTMPINPTASELKAELERVIAWLPDPEPKSYVPPSVMPREPQQPPTATYQTNFYYTEDLGRAPMQTYTQEDANRARNI